MLSAAIKANRPPKLAWKSTFSASVKLFPSDATATFNEKGRLTGLPMLVDVPGTDNPVAFSVLLVPPPLLGRVTATSDPKMPFRYVSMSSLLSEGEKRGSPRGECKVDAGK